ncbi:MAG: hypothetical protein COS57_02000, partial [Syntrophobacterales bacterium CG03_land_8_20_14_0_80_58_14]
MMLETPQYEKGQLYQISIVDFRPDPNQPRKSMDPQALAELADSIKSVGVLQPLLFRVGIGGHDPISPEIGIVSPNSPTPDSPEIGIVSPDSGQMSQSLIIVAGERRWAAAQQAGLTVLPAICVEGNTAEIALVENLQRQDLTPVEEAEALGRLQEEQKYTQEQLGGIIGKAQNTLSETLSLNRLPLTIRNECRTDRTIGKKVLIAIAKKKQERGMMTAYNDYKAKLDKQKAARQKKDP